MGRPQRKKRGRRRELKIEGSTPRLLPKCSALRLGDVRNQNLVIPRLEQEQNTTQHNIDPPLDLLLNASRPYEGSCKSLNLPSRSRKTNWPSEEPGVCFLEQSFSVQPFRPFVKSQASQPQQLPPTAESSGLTKALSRRRMPETVEPANGVAAAETNNLKMAPVTPSITMTAPTDSASEPEPALFADDLISPTIAATLPPTYVLRPLRKSDYAIGFLDVLRVLTTVGDITEEEWNGRYDWMNTQGKGGYYIMVIEDQGKIVGTGALLVERKLCVP